MQEQNKEILTKKFKQKSEHYKSVINKIEHQNAEDIERALRERSEMGQSRSKSFSRSAKDPLLHNKTESIRGSNIDVDLQLSLITEKAKRAHMKHELQQKSAI